MSLGYAEVLDRDACVENLIAGLPASRKSN